MEAATGTAVRKVSMWLLVSAIAAIGTLAAGVVVVNALSERYGSARWETLSDVGESFGAISAVCNGMALTALIVTFWLQYQELRLQRADSREQGTALIRADAELHRTAEANLRLLHLEILKLSIQDPDLAEVWPPFDGQTSEKKNRQFLYANAIFHYQWTALRVSEYSERDIVEHFRYLFTSPLMREYWHAARSARSSLVEGSAEHSLAMQIDRLCEHYDAAASLVGQRAGRERDETLKVV
ncbi:DUF6082 family protein [Actinoplanes sp. NPDC024001]|uniref:DUF6082 family protein n=1 Tax=Actinoplanes sp. NPDC024001 TaxID=3154598 RepID=UPI0033E8DF48